MRTLVTGRKETGQIDGPAFPLDRSYSWQQGPALGKIMRQAEGHPTFPALCDPGPLEERAVICPHSKWPGTMLQELAWNLRNLALSLGSSTNWLFGLGYVT